MPKKKRMRHFAGVAAALLIIAALGGALAWNYIRDNKLPNFGRTAEVYILPGTSADDALSLIADKAQVKSRRSLERSFEAKKVSEYIKPGHYTVSASSSSVYVARMLNNGWQTPVRLSLSGNLRQKDNIAAKIASQMLADSASLRRAMDDDELLASFGITPRSFFSLIIPDTYEIWWTASVEEIFARFKEAYDAYWTSANDAKAKALGLSRSEVSVLASIVDGESNHEPEMPKIAGVYLNRLKLGMMLQADPTVAYCFDYKLSRVLRKHLEVDSPYNTYRHTGLPPGPICSPVRAALDAVLNPDFGGSPGVGNLYFCANPDFSGTHVFAKTLKEHNANADAFRRELNRRAAERRKAAANRQ